MSLLKYAALSFAIVAAPLSAQSLSDTHEMRWAPVGKIPAVTYHAIKRGCEQRTAPIHLSGKTQLAPAPAAEGCVQVIASADRRDQSKAVD
ncbi:MULTISPECIES: hypothetical protein [Sphingomonas]|jgi:hypothetical protein|uniref:Uncharacterized protein n=1 Tax=Sphingomonas echinoides TaxID=59803 RepID=A0ABU4PLV5_9SPHN|nr:hypothetical protein [Sphingomonas echinoides]MDX5984127.1 hypothetical protein [Sphingomonas echinoides]